MPDRTGRVKNWLAHAFAVERDAAFDADERELADRLATFLVGRRMTAPALMALEMGRPVSFLGSQLLAFLSPFLSLVFSVDETALFVRLMEKRNGIDLLTESVIRMERERDV